MKSPMVYKNTEVKIAFFVGIFTSAIVAFTTYDVVEIWQIVGYFLVITGGLTFMAWALRYGTIYTRVVTNCVEPEDLTIGQICYLNGEFQAKFLYKDGYYGHFVFKIEGLDDEVDVIPGRVRMYFSSKKEV